MCSQDIDIKDVVCPSRILGTNIFWSERSACASGHHLGGHYFRHFGPSGVCALPLAAGINEGGRYFRYFGPSVLRAPAEQTKVATILGTFFHIFSSYRRYSKPQKRYLLVGENSAVYLYQLADGSLNL